MRCRVCGDAIKAEVVVCLLVALYRANTKFLLQTQENIYGDKNKVNRFVNEALTLYVSLKWFEIM